MLPGPWSVTKSQNTPRVLFKSDKFDSVQVPTYGTGTFTDGQYTYPFVSRKGPRCHLWSTSRVRRVSLGRLTVDEDTTKENA